MPSNQQIARISDVIFVIHQDIAADLRARTLCAIAAYSEQHFHRIFRKVTGETVHGYVLRSRLEHAANQLTFDRHSPILEVAEKCGFASLSSFTRAFSLYFGTSPGRWRRGENPAAKPAWLADSEIASGYHRIATRALPAPDFEELMPRKVAYIRHQGYNKSITRPWQKLYAWSVSEGRPFTPQIGLHHSNPALIPLNQCRYVACVGIDRPMLRRGGVNCLTIPGGLHARFGLAGYYGELLPWISKILEHWLPDSGFKMQTTPAFVVYRKNQFLDPENRFELDFYLPLTLY